MFMARGMLQIGSAYSVTARHLKAWKLAHVGSQICEALDLAFDQDL
jgi:hypothetical protein